MNVLSILFSLLLAGLPLKPANSFSAGEEQVYIVHYQWGVLNADVARAFCTCDSTTIKGKPGYKARIYGKTEKFCEALVKVREDFTSWFTAEDLRPDHYRRKASEAKFQGGETFTYDWNKGVVDVTISSNRSGERQEQFKIEPGYLDVPSLFYSFRNLDIAMVSDKKPFEVYVVSGEEVTRILFRYEGKETLNARGMDNMSTHKFSIQVTSGNTFDTKNAITLYATDDDVLVPVYFEAPMRIGKVVGRLESSTKKKK